MTHQRFGDDGHRFIGAFHYVAAACTVNVDVNKSGDGGLAAGGNLRRPGGQGHILARPDGFDNAVANQDSGIRYFRSWS